MNDDFDYINTIRRLRASHVQSFKMLYHHLHPALFHFILAKTRDTASAEDILQEVFIKVWETRHFLDETRSLKAYLYAIAQNLTLNSIRFQKLRRSESLDDHEPISENSPHLTLEKKEFQEQLRAAITGLPDQARTVFLMSRQDELSYKEIAERLGISIKTVESHMGNALKLLRRKLLLSGHS